MDDDSTGEDVGNIVGDGDRGDGEVVDSKDRRRREEERELEKNGGDGDMGR